jgi:pSer/pThr/pTyr-binding forkhead associated (FHA) protein/ABC-type branched-subunit amino acid transport system ATPase component
MSRTALLRALHPGPLHTEQMLTGSGCVIGRDGNLADILLHGSRVSRQHCWIGLNDSGEWLLKDLDSTNGVYVNGSRIDGEHPLDSNDVIGLGRSRSADFEFLSGDHDEAIRTRVLDGPGPWLIGRDLAAELSLPADPMVSQRHARLRSLPEGLVIEDLGSRNGTWLDGRSIRRERIKPGKRVIIGNTELELQSPREDSPTFAVRTTRRALGLSAHGLSLGSDGRGGVDFDIRPGRLQVIDSSRIGPASTLIETIAGQCRPAGGRIVFSESSLDDHPDHRRDRIGSTLDDCQPGRRQTMLEWMVDQARLALAGDLPAERVRELAVTTLQAMDMSRLSEHRDQALSPLDRCLFRVAAALLTRPSLLLVDPDLVEDMDADSVEILIDRLRPLANSTLSIMVATDKPPDNLSSDEAVKVQSAQAPGSGLGNAGSSIAPRRASTTVTAILMRLCIGPWRQLSGTLPEALLLPLILLPGLWYALPGHTPVLAAILTMTIGPALETATLVARAQTRLIPLARRHLLLGDVLLALLIIAALIAMGQLLVVQTVLVVTGALSPITAVTVLPTLMLVTLSALALGLMCGVLAGPRVLPAVLLAALLTLLQVLAVGWMDTAETVGPLARRLADLSGAFWGLNLYNNSQSAAGPGETTRPLAFLAGQMILFLALARTALRRRIQAA